MKTRLRPHLLASVIQASFLLVPLLAAAQEARLADSLDKVRSLRRVSILDASDRVAEGAFRQLVLDEPQLPAREKALWEVADVHLEAANRVAPGADNAYARRAIEAWTEYIEFALANNQTARLHSAVELAQRSYLQASDSRGMFEYFPRVEPKYVNDSALTRWEDRLRTCSAFGPPPRPWAEQQCRQEECRESVASFYDFSQRWLQEFPLRTDQKKTFASRIERIPKSCREW
jgi:hypothetical protein